MIPPYHINLFWSDEDACWIADVPDLRGCSAHGASPEQAVAEIRIAIELYIESLVAHHDPVPEPRYRPAIYAVAHAA